jgi:hypothetical protein
MWDDIDFDRGTIRISRSLEEVDGELSLKAPKTKKSRRTVALSFSLDALQELRKMMLAEGSYGADRPVFCGVRTRVGFANRTSITTRSPHREACGPEVPVSRSQARLRVLAAGVRN